MLRVRRGVAGAARTRKSLVGQLVAGTLLAGALVAGWTPAPAQAADAATTFVTMVGESGEYISGGQADLWRPGAGEVSLSGSVDDQVQVNVAGGPSGDDFTFTFGAAGQDSLVPGDYERADGATGHPVLGISGSGRGCTSTGRFTVLDIDPALTRFWLVYEMRCGNGSPAAFGEVRVNEPGGDSDLLVAPDRVAWPAGYPHVAGRNVPVRLVNTGAAPLTVAGAAITDGAADFSVKSSTCGTLAVGASCQVNVGFTPSTSGARSGTLTIQDSSAAGSHTVALSGAGIPGNTAWQMRSDRGDYIGGGEDWSYTPQDTRILASGDQSRIQASTEDGSWTADFEADSGRTLTPGTTFTGATRFPFNDATTPGMDVSGSGRGCNEIKGSFTVHEASYDDTGALEKLSISFVQHCEGATPALYGSITWHADQPGAPLPPRVSIRTDRSSYDYGSRAVVTAKVSADSPVRTLSVYATPPGGVRKLVTTGTVDRDGLLVVRVPVVQQTTFTVALDGQGQVPSTSATRSVSVHAKVTPTMQRYRSKSGRYYVYGLSQDAFIQGKVSPDHAGDCLYFRAEFLVAGSWQYPATTKCVDLSSASTARAYLAGNPNYRGIPIRMRAEWRGDKRNLAENSAWRYLKFVG